MRKKKKKIDEKHLFYGVAFLNLVPIRSKPSDGEVLVSQLLFGETCIILEKKNKHWFKIQVTTNDLIGWINSLHIQLIDEATFVEYNRSYSLSLEVSYPLFNEEMTKTICIGSRLPKFDGLSCFCKNDKFVFNGQAAPENGLDFTTELFKKIARRYLHTPELRGGRSPFGIDAISFVQAVYGCFGYQIKHDLELQSQVGESIDFINLSQEGDLAFFMNDDGLVNHIGLLIGDQKIIHVFGHVRIDSIDHHGIFNYDLHKYTHKLRITKRVISANKGL